MQNEPTVTRNSLVTTAQDLATSLEVKEQQFTKIYNAKKQSVVSMSNVVRFGAMFAICAVIGPVVYLAIKGIVGLAAFGALVFLGYNAAPVIAQKVTNAKTLALEAERNAFYRALDAEKNSHISKVAKAAAADPIATARSQSNDYKKRAERSLEAITAYGTEVRNFENMTADFSRKYPDNAKMYRDQLETMKKALEHKNSKYKELMEKIKTMDDQISFLEANWKMSQALQKANALGGGDLADPMEQVKADAAIDAVRNSINKAFAEMDSAVLQASATQSGTPFDRSGLLTNDPSQTLPMSTPQTTVNNSNNQG